jgi:signal transduction histidine kinase/serine phosphatase RsbU (regulator of sigma subunit)
LPGKKHNKPDIETLAFDNQGRLWFGGKGMFGYFDPSSQELVSYSQLLEIMPEERRSIYNFLFDENGVLWIAAYAGVFKMLPDTNALIKIPLSEKLPNFTGEQGIFPIDLAIDDQGQVWITTMSGLVRWNPKTEKARQYTTKDGLADNLGFAVEALDDHLWISHSKGLTRYNPETRQALNYNLYDGLQNRFFWKSSFKNARGELFFGGSNGFNHFDPNSFQTEGKTHELVLTDLHLDEKDFEPDLSLNEVEEIVIPYTNEFIKVYFSVMDFTIPEKNLYSYRLNGWKEGKWTVPSNDNNAYLSHLPPGSYTLQMRGANHQGVWSENGRELRITVLPPFWQTPIAYVLYVLVTILLIALFYTIRTRQLSARARELEAQVAEQTRSLRLAKEKTEAQAAKLLEMDQLKSQFFSNVSHEFRTPLTLIIGPLESLMSATVVPDNELKRHHSVMLRNARRLLRLINQLLDISKLEAGRMQLCARPVDPCRFFRPIVFAFQSLADKSGISLAFECDQDLDAIYLDPEKMEKVLFNLLSNAFQFTSAGGSIEIHVKTLQGDAGREVVIVVADTGEGIAKEDQALIFDRFRQADGSSTREKEGTGIGLSLVKELVELHRGHIGVESEKGRGATFTVTLPLGHEHLTAKEIVSQDTHYDYAVADEKANIEMAHLHAISPTKREDHRDGPLGSTVLVVDDNADIRQYISENLSGQYRILEAENGQVGLDIAKQVRPDLIVTDVMMPVMDGYELCRKVRAHKQLQRTPIIMLTAKATDEMRVEGLEIGADEYLSKPFNVRELQVRVKNLLQIRGQEKQMRQSLEMAHKVQVSMLPLEMPQVQGLEIASFCVPAREVGGDYFDFLTPRNGHTDIGVFIGDVSGKGMSAALYMTMTKGLVQAFGGDCESPRETLSLINRQFHRASASNAFLSLSYAKIDTVSKKMIFASAGHNPPILYSPSRGKVEMVKSPGMAIGLESKGLFDKVTQETELQLDSGDILFFYTDGITEGMNERQEIYGEERLIDLIKANGNLCPNDLLDRLRTEHQHFVNGMEQFDDMTAVVVKIP